jgi:hypothetical protein
MALDRLLLAVQDVAVGLVLLGGGGYRGGDEKAETSEDRE